MTLVEFRVRCLDCNRPWLRVGHIPLQCPFCHSWCYKAVRDDAQAQPEAVAA